LDSSQCHFTSPIRPCAFRAGSCFVPCMQVWGFHTVPGEVLLSHLTPWTCFQTMLTERTNSHIQGLQGPALGKPFPPGWCVTVARTLGKASFSKCLPYPPLSAFSSMEPMRIALDLVNLQILSTPFII
jgi:hypothetical protein